jgi:hypothetical protein
MMVGFGSWFFLSLSAAAAAADEGSTALFLLSFVVLWLCSFGIDRLARVWFSFALR